MLVTHLPLMLGANPTSEHILTVIKREATTVATALSARPHLDLTISILAGMRQTANIINNMQL